MELVLISHPSFLSHQSMPRFARMLADGMKDRGHSVQVWSPKAKYIRLPAPSVMRKWLGYIDQYLLFPQEMRERLKFCSPNTLFVITDNALGPYVPFLAQRPHVVHCHDFLAQRSALGQIPENLTSWTGRRYQTFIRRGYSKGKHFIAISQKTKQDLCQFISTPPVSVHVVYNFLNQSFLPVDPSRARQLLSQKLNVDLTVGYLLHVGGNIWYKNRVGVIEIYNAWRSTDRVALPMLMIGEQPDSKLLKQKAVSTYGVDVHFITDADDEVVRMAYAGASAFIFPSLDEGFGWPIAEAMASGCPVITTNTTPMTEVAGEAGFLIPRRPHDISKVESWANEAACTVRKVLNLSASERKAVVDAGLKNAERFNTKNTLDSIEEIYLKIVGV